MIERFLLRWWPAILLGLSSIGLAVALMLTAAQRDAAVADRARVQIEADIAKGMLERQNEGIRALREAADQNRELYLAGLRAAENRAIRLTVEAEDILALPEPPSPDLRCEYAADVLRGVTQ